jgi:transcriptional regulator with XRE-family HTH domain
MSFPGTVIEYSRMEFDFGQTIRRHRKQIHVSQARMAEAMTGLGFEMHQTTFAKLERAARPILLTEALALSDLLMIHPDVWPKPNAFRANNPWSIPAYTVVQQTPQQPYGISKSFADKFDLEILFGKRPPT